MVKKQGSHCSSFTYDYQTVTKGGAGKDLAVTQIAKEVEKRFLHPLCRSEQERFTGCSVIVVEPPSKSIWRPGGETRLY
jgi:hypothetical protein